MSKTVMLRARTEQELKERAEDVLREMGLPPTQAMTIFDRQVVRGQGLPFALRLRRPSIPDESSSA